MPKNAARRLATLGDLQSARHGGTRNEGVQHALDVRELVELDQLARAVENDPVAHPWEDRDVGDGVLLAHDPRAALQALLKHRQQALGFADVAVAWALVLVLLAGELVEEADLAEHRAVAAHLEHQPLDGLVTTGRVRWYQLAGLLGQVQQDGA